MTSHEPKNADAVRRNGKLTLKGEEIDIHACKTAFSLTVKLLDKQAGECGLSNTHGHNTAVSALSAAFKAYLAFCEECRRAIERK